MLCFVKKYDNVLFYSCYEERFLKGYHFVQSDIVNMYMQPVIIDDNLPVSKLLQLPCHLCRPA